MLPYESFKRNEFCHWKSLIIVPPTISTCSVQAVLSRWGTRPVKQLRLTAGDSRTIRLAVQHLMREAKRDSAHLFQTLRLILRENHAERFQIV